MTAGVELLGRNAVPIEFVENGRYQSGCSE
jgi:hypothetical protein